MHLCQSLWSFDRLPPSIPESREIAESAPYGGAMQAVSFSSILSSCELQFIFSHSIYSTSKMSEKMILNSGSYFYSYDKLRKKSMLAFTYSA